ncbi:MAG: ADP-ribosylglycohydrolase family protein [Opitutaceae bacterium]|jgi:ADP-ribosylglycohydrolase
MKTKLPSDYEERVYAGVLGKLVGVYLGRPFEGWFHEDISKRWGEIRRYVHGDLNKPLIVPDDDITGTFTFVRALLDHGIRPDLSAREIGQSWLNYIAKGRHILWWGGLGLSAEHTAYLRLESGIEAPRSGSIELNGTAVAEEIGAQIFIDGWAMIAPGNPELAVRLAREAASVSHDGEAIHGAVIIAAMEALAFVEADINVLLDRALTYIPADCQIARLIADLRGWHRDQPDWRKARELLVEHYGYQKFGTNCPVISNHGVIILSLLYGAGDFDRSMMIVNTCGYDTDCNSGNLGCLLGIRNGLSTLRSGYDWRTPVNDRMYLPAADGHRGMRDAATMALELANIGRVFAGERPRVPKDGVRFHFDLPGATHGFAPSSLCPKEVTVTSEDGALRLRVEFPGMRCDAEVATFLTPESFKLSGNYDTSATPTLYAGNRIRARVLAGSANPQAVGARLFVRAHAGGEATTLAEGPLVEVRPGRSATLEWMAPETSNWPIFAVGVQVLGPQGSRLDIDWLTWDGTPTRTFAMPEERQDLGIWNSSFVHNLEGSGWQWRALYQRADLMKNQGRGLIHTGAREWRDYRVSSRIEPSLCGECGIAARVQGLTRLYALLLRPGGKLALVRRVHDETVLAETDCPWELRRGYDLALEVRGDALVGFVDGRRLLEAKDSSLVEGGIGIIVSDGRITATPPRIEALRCDDPRTVFCELMNIEDDKTRPAPACREQVIAQPMRAP